MAKISLVQIYRNQWKMIIDVIEFINNYELDIGPKNSLEFKESVKEELYTILSLQEAYRQLAQSRAKIRELKTKE